MSKTVKHIKIKAFSLVETLVTLAIFGILLAMLSQVLMMNLQVSRKISARTTIREEMTQLVGLIQRDIRNADTINTDKCDKDILLSNSFPSGVDTGCEFSQDNNQLSWVLSNNESNGCLDNAYNDTFVKAMCKLDLANPSSPSILYKTSTLINIKKISIEKQYILDEEDESNKPSKSMLIITIEAAASNVKWDVNNQIRQIIVTTRNF